MITTFSDYSQNSNTPLNNEQEGLIEEYLGSYIPKICCLESYWNQNMTDPLSVKPFLKAIGWMIEKEIVVTHRMIDSGAGLSYYTKYPDGLIWQDPKLAGIDLFYIAVHGKPGGHSDVVAGVCCGSKERIAKLFANEFLTLGGILSPFDAWLTLRGLRTLPIRMEHVSNAANKIIAYLKTQPKISRIYYPFLPENEQYALSVSQMKKGSGLFTVEVNSTPEAIEDFCNNLTYWRMAVSWGGFESLIIPSCTFVRPGLYSSLPPTLIRFSVGLEDVETLIQDIEKNISRL